MNKKVNELNLKGRILNNPTINEKNNGNRIFSFNLEVDLTLKKGKKDDLRVASIPVNLKNSLIRKIGDRLRKNKIISVEGWLREQGESNVFLEATDLKVLNYCWD
ncbi:MAG: single-stranded DNA-binding protein [Spirochaetes bacterium]|nr:single-stranded DNA-binding protein [Spirochaetota bacterium]